MPIPSIVFNTSFLAVFIHSTISCCRLVGQVTSSSSTTLLICPLFFYFHKSNHSSNISRKLKLFFPFVKVRIYENRTSHESEPKNQGQNGTSGKYLANINMFKITECPARIVSVYVWSEIKCLSVLYCWKRIHFF